MPAHLRQLRVKNYRSLADVVVDLDRVNVFFGPNGAGKSSVLDTIWFMRGCAAQGVDATTAERDHGIGLLWDGAPDGATISIALATDEADYELILGLGSGRIDPLAGELLLSLRHKVTLIERASGSDKVAFHHSAMDEPATHTLREPEKISLPRFLDYDPYCTEAVELNNLIRYVHFYHSRSLKLYPLRKFGSESGHETWLWNFGENLWSVLRNLQGRRAVDERYDTIIKFMAKSFPKFKDLVLDATSPTVVYGSIVESGLKQPIRASGVSDGHLQMLVLLTALFAEGKGRAGLTLLDEPELSLHPWALAVLAEAIEEAAAHWSKQIFLATHSPVLLSQFDAPRILAVEPSDRGTRIRRLSEMEEVKDLLNQYAPGSLYMAQMVGGQNELVGVAE